MAVRIQNTQCEWRIGDDGLNLGFFDRKTGRNYALPVPQSPCAYVKKGGWRADAISASFLNGLLSLEFADGAGKASIDVQINDGYFVFTVLSVEGDIDELAFINIPTSLAPEADLPFSACTIALGLKSNVEELPGPQEHLWSAAYKRFGFEGAQTGLVACSFAEMREYMKKMVGAAPGVPHSPLCGPWALDSELPAFSNVMEAPTLQNVDQWIDFCHRMGIKAIEFNGTLDYGSYLPRPSIFPNGFADVKLLTDKLHAAGILAGLHTMSFSIAKNCSWVSPKPDPRLAKERSYTLSADIDADTGDIPLDEDTSDLPSMINYYIRRSMTVQIDDELIVYTEVKTDAPYAVLKCSRGMHGTAAVPHTKGAKVHHLKECWGCFAPDGDSTLFSEVADRISTAVNECNFDFVYLDGLDGAHIIGGEDARWHYGAKFTFEVFRGLKHPIMMEMATFHHHLWYVRTRMQAWDHNKRDHKKFTDLHVYSNSYARKLFMPLHMGWIGLFPWTDQQTDPTFWDDVEYIWSKSLATDANFTLQCLTPESLVHGAWLHELAPAVKQYEELRLSHHFSKEVKDKLVKAGDEYRLCPVEDGKWAFQPIHAERHQVNDLDGLSDKWTFNNKFAPQPMGIRIQALPSIAPYDSPEAIQLTDFTAPGEFTDPGDTITILNSGKLYTYPSNAPGMSSKLVPVSAEGPASACGQWTASRTNCNGLIPSSGPDDRFSLCDHFERNYDLREASWSCLATAFSPAIDLSKNQGMGVWIKGDGKGELANIVLISKTHGLSRAQHYVKIDFTGWRYVELLETSTVEFEEHSWPFARCHYDIYRSTTNFPNAVGMHLWYNDIPKGDTVSCLLSPIKALPLVVQPLVKPVVTVNGQSIMFPVSLKAGQYLEYYGGPVARVYEGNGNLLGEVAPQGAVPVLENGGNNVNFACNRDKLRPHARITLFTKDDSLMGDVNCKRDIPWNWGCLAAGKEDFGSTAIHAEGEEIAQNDFLAP